MTDITGIFSESFWWIAPILVFATTALTGVINGAFKIKGVWQQIVSWIVGIILSVAAWALSAYTPIVLITFGNPVWLGVICLCIVVGLASNGVYDIPTIKNWIDKWFSNKPKI